LLNKKILVVDDDIRNIYALITALERYQVNVIYAENGREGIEVLQENSDIELILMDIMMPEMDGFEAIKLICKIPEFEKLPIIALTAKAMKNDREKCIEAGASDYISKPVNLEQLFSIMRVWLYR
jgi:two-component system chemotaxis sensor kinase CheA